MDLRKKFDKKPKKKIAVKKYTIDSYQHENYPLLKMDTVSFVLGKKINNSLYEKTGLTFSEFLILRIMDFKPGMTQKLIADFRTCTEASVSKHLQLMLKKKVIVRLESKDQRENVFTFTKSGKQKITIAKKIARNELQKALKGLTDKHIQILSESLDIIFKTLTKQGNI